MVLPSFDFEALVEYLLGEIDEVGIEQLDCARDGELAPAGPGPAAMAAGAESGPQPGADLGNVAVGVEGIEGRERRPDGRAYYPPGGQGDPYGAIVTAPDLYGQSYEGVPIFLNEVNFEVTLHPSADRTGGLGRVAVTELSDDGRTLQFQARLWVIEDWNLAAISVVACEPDVGSDAMIFEADCVEGPPGFDAAYQGSTVAATWIDPGSGTGPLAISLLLDQAGSVVVTDPADRRLLPAVGELIQFTANSAPADSRRAVVALTSGGFYGCGEREECATAREARLDESAATGVSIVAVGLSDPSGAVDRKGLGPFAQAAQAAVFWARDPRQVPTIFGRLPAVLDDSYGAVDVTIELQSTVAGAFASGNTVAGTLRIEVCPFDCRSVDIPFGLRVR